MCVCVCLRVFVKKRPEFKFVLRVLLLWISFGCGVAMSSRLLKIIGLFCQRAI